MKPKPLESYKSKPNTFGELRYRKLLLLTILTVAVGGALAIVLLVIMYMVVK